MEALGPEPSMEQRPSICLGEQIKDMLSVYPTFSLKTLPNRSGHKVLSVLKHGKEHFKFSVSSMHPGHLYSFVLTQESWHMAVAFLSAGKDCVDILLGLFHCQPFALPD